ncbi:hypothetical protein Cus16_1941 [Curtobacterium sp. ER1/6]|nr:hypothetical protein Cus16_1941 [Curtobacterium sp. ER1/6]
MCGRSVVPLTDGRRGAGRQRASRPARGAVPRRPCNGWAARRFRSGSAAVPLRFRCD